MIIVFYQIHVYYMNTLGCLYFSFAAPFHLILRYSLNFLLCAIQVERIQVCQGMLI